MSDDASLGGLLLGFSLREVLGWDLLVAVMGGAGGFWLAAFEPERLGALAPVAASLVGVVIGVVIATATIIAAFMDPAFLRKMRAIGEDPVRYLAPYIFSGVLGTVGAITAIVVAAVPPTAPTWVLASAACVGGFFVLYALASLISNLSNLMGFIRLQIDAAEVSEQKPAGRSGSNPN